MSTAFHIARSHKEAPMGSLATLSSDPELGGLLGDLLSVMTFFDGSLGNLFGSLGRVLGSTDEIMPV